MQEEFKNDFSKYFKFINYSLSLEPKYITYDGSKKVSVDAPSYSHSKFQYALANGALMDFYINGGPEGKWICMKVDINGFKPPNRYGFDVFIFLVKSSDDKLVGRKMIRLYTDEEAEEDIYSGAAGVPCSKKSKQSMNGIGCAGYALADECPDDPTKGYWDCLPN